MVYNKCQRCGDLVHPARECHCQPYLIITEDGDEWGEIWAKDARDAALEYAEKSNVDGDYYLMDEPVEITVGGSKFVIGAEPDIHYSANAVD